MIKNVAVSINGNIPEWQACFQHSGAAPRLPLPYAFGAGLTQQGFRLAAQDMSDQTRPSDIAPFSDYYMQKEFSACQKSVDLIILWGTHGLKSCLAEAHLPRSMRKTILLSYAWRPQKHAPLLRQGFLKFSRLIARFSRGLILMTQEQINDARSSLPSSIPVIRLRVGIDTKFYAKPSKANDVPEKYKSITDSLLQESYIILPGDQLRLNDDALKIAKLTGLKLVRISQYNNKSDTNSLKKKVFEFGLKDHVIVFERISYRFLRFLLQNAAAYVGLVDSSWQPAGWTVACESLACGLPLVLYEGFTSRELTMQGCKNELMKTVAHGDLEDFARKLVNAIENSTPELRLTARKFAVENLDFQTTASEFGKNFLSSMSN